MSDGTHIEWTDASWTPIAGEMGEWPEDLRVREMPQ